MTRPPSTLADFEEVYDRHFEEIHGYLAGRLGAEAADDLAAETFVVAFRKRASFDPGRGAVRPWLYGIATNLVAQHRRSEARRLAALRRAAPEQAQEGPEEQVVDRLAVAGAQGRLAAELAGLADGDRDVLLLVALGELSYEEVAQALGIPYGTVGSRLNRARRKLRAALNGLYGGGDE
ncbi:RNA polymerase sigma factor [Thermoactinospora rubra]|uniref:RNA polymerase sigma factor n=1 Tax=Thermoactinospora rubra TaxID=1088767 RepID=UPI000A0F7F04|nr:RNA polymerase sigma factor [Thermoactinospora rubra]